MQAVLKAEEPGQRGRRGRTVSEAARLGMPVTGLESEFNVVLDGVEIDPRAYWKDPTAFIDVPLLRRTRSSLQLPTGGAVYFDRGVIEVVTPVIELAPGCTARVVRNLWEQVAFVRDQLTRWEQRTGHQVRLKAYSTHYNISFELRRREQSAHRNIQKIALLLAYILPVPVAVVACNRRSTGVGVRPRENRIEVTVDFTPDPGLMIAAATLITGIVREVLSWPSYELEELDRRRIPVPAGVVPGKHTTRKGWLTKDHQYPQSPYSCDIDARIWTTRDGGRTSLREMARGVAWFFRQSIRRYADSFSVRHLFALLNGCAPTMLDLADRPAAYEDVGRRCAWGMVLPGLRALARGDAPPGDPPPASEGTYAEWLAAHARERVQAEPAAAPPGREGAKGAPEREAESPAGGIATRGRAGLPGLRSEDSARRRRHIDNPLGDVVAASAQARRRLRAVERRRRERRARREPMPFPDRRLTRSAYEQVFLKLVSGGRLRLGAETYTPVGMRGWDRAVFRRDSDGRPRLLSIDQLLRHMTDWQ